MNDSSTVTQMHVLIRLCRRRLEYNFRYSFFITRRERKRGREEGRKKEKKRKQKEGRKAGRVLLLEEQGAERQLHPSASVFGKLRLNQAKTSWLQIMLNRGKVRWVQPRSGERLSNTTN